MTRFIFITGGVVSSLGKGLSAAGLAAILQARGYKVRMRKLDPYLNVDPGTMSPYQHGEVFVTEDGAETDLDLGHYERFTGVNNRKSDNITSGRIYQTIIEKERRGDFLGGTVQVIPHVTNEIKAFIRADIEDEDFVICEIGGTVGDIEGLPFIEAIRQLGRELGTTCLCYIHLTLVPYIKTAGELKTKPTQHSVREMQSYGIRPDILVCRTEHPIGTEERRKIALFCSIHEDNVIQVLDAPSIYALPQLLHEEGLDNAVLRHFGLSAEKPNLTPWSTLLESVRTLESRVKIGIVGKYIVLKDAYKSLIEALHHGGFHNKLKVELIWIDAEELETTEKPDSLLAPLDGILVPGAFGARGSEGKIHAAHYARINKIPFLGICMGMQIAMIEFFRNVLGERQAGSSEFGPACPMVVGLMTEWTKDNQKEQRNIASDMGGTMRLGAYECQLRAGSKAAKIYGCETIFERHRHRYEINASYVPKAEAKGLQFTGLSPDGMLPEIFELDGHPWYIAVQFHPELKSRPLEPHPLFSSFIKAARDQSMLI